MSDSKVVVKSGLWYTISNFFTKGVLFLTTPIFTELLTKEEFGAFGNFSSWLNIFVIITTLNVEASLISARYDYEHNLNGYMFSALSLSTASTLVWALIFNLFMAPLSDFLGIDPVSINCMFAYLLFFPALQLFQAQERFFFRYKSSTFLSILTTVGSCGLSVAFVLLMQNKVLGRVVGHVMPTVVVGLALYILIAARGKKIDFGVWKYVLKVCMPYVPHLLSMTVLNSTDRIMISQMRGDAETALYTVAYNVAMIVTLFMTALNGAFSPWLAEKLSKEQYKDIRKASKGYILLFMAFGVGLLLLSPEILYIMGGADYMEAKPIMIPIAVGCMCQFLYTLFVNIEQFYKKTVGMAIASVSAALLNFLLNLWLVPKFGYIAAAYTTLIGYVWLLCIHMLLVRIMEKHYVYSYKFVLFTMLGLAVLTGLMMLVYMNFIVRYILVLLYAAAFITVVVLNRKKLLGFIKK